MPVNALSDRIACVKFFMHVPWERTVDQPVEVLVAAPP